jgi:hypothetical protein
VLGSQYIKGSLIQGLPFVRAVIAAACGFPTLRKKVIHQDATFAGVLHLVQWAADTENVLRCHVGVDHRGLQMLVSEKLLNCPDVAAVLKARCRPAG